MSMQIKPALKKVFDDIKVSTWWYACFIQSKLIFFKCIIYYVLLGNTQ
jgi:hypothetical protein